MYRNHSKLKKKEQDLKKLSLDSFSGGLDLINGDPEDLVQALLNLEWEEKENLI